MLNYSTLTNRQGLIVWGGKSSTDYGIVVSEAPAFDKPVLRTDVFNIPGRNGSVLYQNGTFNDTTRSYKVWIDEDATEDSGGVISGTLADRVYAFAGWLYSQTGYKRLEDNFEPDIFRMAYISGGQDITNELLMAGETTITFICRPERYLKSGETAVTIVSSGVTIDNPTKFNSKPLLRVYGSGEYTLSINSQALTINVDGYIDIDCEQMNAWKGTVNKNSDISGVFPELVPGTNTITFSGFTKIEITPRFYYI